MSNPNVYVATVRKVIIDKGYIVTRCDAIDDIVTISLKNSTWKEKKPPQIGDVVVIEDIRWHNASFSRGGWRATQARFFRPEDKKALEAKST